MKLRLVSTVFLIPAVAFFAAGCGGGDKPSEKPTGSSGPSSAAKSETKKSGGAKEMLASTGTGTVKGKFVFDGDPPKPATLDMNKDTEHCKKGPPNDTTDPTWRVGPDKGLANVIVWLQAPADKYFKIPDDMKSVKQPAVVDQPFCAFEPHVFVLYPTYFDGKQQQPTGQKLKIMNSAPIAHNSNVTFSDPILNTGGNNLLAAGKDVELGNIVSSREKDCSKTQDLNITCNVHQWMKSFGKIFDHPFVAKSSGDNKGDKTFGNFEIKQAPTGVEVAVMYWHESMAKPVELKKVTLKDGDNDLGEIKIKK